jgi:hypothetical protein
MPGPFQRVADRSPLPIMWFGFSWPQALAASRSIKSAESWGMADVRLIKHEAVPKCSSFEVRVDGRPRYFYWDDEASRRLRSGQITGAQALELAKLLACGLSIIR